MVRRRAWVVLLCVVLATAAAVALTLRAEERYESTSGLLLRSGSDPQRTADTNLQLLTLPAVAERAAELEPAAGAEEYEDSIAVAQKGESDIIQIDANAASPDLAAAMANAYAEAFIEYRQDEESAISGGKVALVERATPESTPVSPKKSRNVGFGALIGLVLGLGLALLLEQLDRRVKRQGDATEVTGLSLLATVPKRKAFGSDRFGHSSLSPAETEIFLMLRANLRYFNVDREVRSVLVTSAQPGEGKTTISLGLALGAAMSGEKVLLIEADLRDPSLSTALRSRSSPGLSWALSSPHARLSEALIRADGGLVADVAKGTGFDVLPSGQIPANPTELIQSKRMKDVLREAEDQYDFVVVDAPPLLVVADAIPIVPLVSGVLAVSGLGVSTRSSAHDLASQLERMRAHILGLVANFATDTGRSYEGYGYGRPPGTLMRDQHPAERAAGSGRE